MLAYRVAERFLSNSMDLPSGKYDGVIAAHRWSEMVSIRLNFTYPEMNKRDHCLSRLKESQIIFALCNSVFRFVLRRFAINIRSRSIAFSCKNKT